MKQESNTKETPKKTNFKYVTLVLKYFDKNPKTSHNVTDVICSLMNQLQVFNKNTGYDGVKFDLYGVCVEEDTDIAEAKNDFIKQIDS